MANKATTLELFKQYLNEMLKCIEYTEDANIKLLDELGVALANAIAKDSEDAESWRRFEGQVENAIAEFEFKKGLSGGKKGGFN